MSGTHCLFCGADTLKAPTFHSFFSTDIRPQFCRSCREKLAPIPPDCRCSGCGRDLRLTDSRFTNGSFCGDCRRWRKNDENILYGRNMALFTYNDHLKEIITAFKFRGDAAIIAGFRDDFRSLYRDIQRKEQATLVKRIKKMMQPTEDDAYVPVPIPLSRQRLQERGFNQSELLAALLPDPMIHALIRTGSEQKQSKKTRRERLTPLRNPFVLREQCEKELEGRRILLVDDIYTTGATLHLAAEILQKTNPACIDSLTLAHG